MVAHTNPVRSTAEKEFCDEEELLKALDGLQPAASQKKNAVFAKIYPGILRAIARKVPQKDILDMLKREGLKLNPIRYRAMLDAESKIRDSKGERICCDACGALLDHLKFGEPSELSESANLHGMSCIETVNDK